MKQAWKQHDIAPSPATNGRKCDERGLQQSKTLRDGWYPRPELNRDQRFRKPLLYPFELRRHFARTPRPKKMPEPRCQDNQDVQIPGDDGTGMAPLESCNVSGCQARMPLTTSPCTSVKR